MSPQRAVPLLCKGNILVSRSGQIIKTNQCLHADQSTDKTMQLRLDLGRLEKCELLSMPGLVHGEPEY